MYRCTALIVMLLVFSPGFAELAIVGGTVVPATGDSPIPNATLLIKENRIEAIGRDTDVPDGYTVIDATGKWITPGIIDTNVHLILTTVPEFFVKYEDRLTDIAIQSAEMSLKFGMTTVADTWGPLGPLLEARDRINAGEFVASRVLVAGNIIGTGGPFSDYFMGGWPLHGDTIRYGEWVHPAIQQRIDALWEDDVGPRMLSMTPEEAADTLRGYIDKGVDMVKIGVSGHSLGSHEPLQFSEEALRAMAEVVREAGIPLLTHTFTVESLRAAIEIEPDLLLHPNVMNVAFGFASKRQKQARLELIEQVASSGIYAGLMQIPVKSQIEIYRNWDESEHPDKPHLNQIMRNRKGWMTSVPYDDLVAGTREWLKRDVLWTLATDQGPDTTDLGPVVWGRLGRMQFSRLEGFQDMGEAPMDILIAATRNGAAAYGLEDDLGTVEEGKIADILILDADPLEDIRNLRRIHMVVKDGKEVDRDALPTVKVLDYDPAAPWPF